MGPAGRSSNCEEMVSGGVGGRRVQGVYAGCGGTGIGRAGKTAGAGEDRGGGKAEEGEGSCDEVLHFDVLIMGFD